MSTSTSDLDSDTEDGFGERVKKSDGGSGRETEGEMRKRIVEELEKERRTLEKELKELKEKREDGKVTGKSECLGEVELSEADLSTEQRQAIFAAPDFSTFIEESTRIVQRALSDGYDYIRDYTIGIESDLWVYGPVQAGCADCSEVTKQMGRRSSLSAPSLMSDGPNDDQ